MIYLVTNDNERFADCELYKVVTVEESLRILEPMRIIGLDTETDGLDCHTKKLLSIQLGNFDDQVVIDCLTVDPCRYKDLLESEGHLFLGWNLKFDLKFLFNYRIVPRNCHDGMLAEKLLWLGYPPGTHSMSLKSAGMKYLGLELDKSIRGQIIYKGLVNEVIKYAADDVKYLEGIVREQRKELAAKGLLRAIDIENKFLIPLSYTEWCGVKLDVDRWKEKMKKDQAREEAARKALDDWLVNEFSPDNPELGYRVVKAFPIDLNESAARYGLDPIYQWYYNDGSEGQTIQFPLPDDAVLVKDNTAVEKDYHGRDVLKGTRTYKLPDPGLLDMVGKLRRKYIFVDRQGDLFKGFNLEPQVSLNWNSTQQVAPLLRLFGVNLMVKNKDTGGMKESLDSKVLKPQKDKCSLIPLYIDYKEAVKVTSTYGENFLKQINPVTGRIHTNFMQMGADTTRVTSGGMDKSTKKSFINLLNLPADAETRRCFIAEKGNRWISADYSG